MQTTISSELLSLMMDGHVACQVAHNGVSPCLVEAVSAIRCCDWEGFACQTATDGNRAAMLAEIICSGCEKPAADCWQIRPI